MDDFNFNSRAHVERDLDLLVGQRDLGIFQLTRSRGARQHTPHECAPYAHFNSRAHVERDLKKNVLPKFESTISTHALTWSATGGKVALDIAKKNFNSRAHVERDRFCCGSRQDEGNFNSRAHVERDGIYGRRVQRYHHFNSRAHVERDPSVWG